MRAWCWAYVMMCGAALAQSPIRVGRPSLPVVANPSGTIPPATAAALRSLAGRAAVIFVGRVSQVELRNGADFVDVVFTVEIAVRGANVGTRYTLREWAGLWADWPTRYVTGQRRLMLLAARGPSGMSSPVGGMAGIIPVQGARKPPLLHGTKAAPAEDVSEITEDSVDLRWVQAVGERATTSTAGHAMKVGGEEAWREPVAKMPIVLPRAAGGPGLTAVLTLLGAEGSRVR